MKKAYLSSKWYALNGGWKIDILRQDDQVYFKWSSVLEDWIDIYIDDRYAGTIPLSEFKREFMTHANLNMGT